MVKTLYRMANKSWKRKSGRQVTRLVHENYLFLGNN